MAERDRQQAGEQRALDRVAGAEVGGQRERGHDLGAAQRCAAGLCVAGAGH
jgi:hypothetical protein